MIQGVISRMSGFSATVKNFAVTLSVAIAAIAFDKEAPQLFWAAAAATVLFFAMDAYYHLLEVRYRELYRATATNPIEKGSDMLLDAPKANAASVRKVLSSLTLAPFYVLLLFSQWIAVKEAHHVLNPKVESVASAAGHVGSSTEVAAQHAGRSGGALAAEKRPVGVSRPAASTGDKRAGEAR